MKVPLIMISKNLLNFSRHGPTLITLVLQGTECEMGLQQLAMFHE